MAVWVLVVKIQTKQRAGEKAGPKVNCHQSGILEQVNGKTKVTAQIKIDDKATASFGKVLDSCFKESYPRFLQCQVAKHSVPDFFEAPGENIDRFCSAVNGAG